jgi:pentatricopeptide repeat protein
VPSVLPPEKLNSKKDRPPTEREQMFGWAMKISKVLEKGSTDDVPEAEKILEKMIDAGITPNSVVFNMVTRDILLFFFW